MKESIQITWKRFKHQREKITVRDICFFLRHLATLTDAGIPLIQAFDLLEPAQTKIKLKRLIYGLKANILAGNSLSNSLVKYGHFFDPFAQQLIHIGEQTGNVDEMLLRIAEYYEKNLRWQKRLWQAAFYPCLILGIASLLLLSVLIFIIPHFASLFTDNSLALPYLTLCLFKLSAGLNNYGPWLMGSLLFNIVLAYFYPAYWQLIYQAFRNSLQGLPLVKKFRQQVFAAHFMEQLYLLLSAGVALPKALQVLKDQQDDSRSKHYIQQLIIGINGGLPLHQVMANKAFYTELIIQMIKIGESTGKLESMLAKIAKMLETEIQDRLNMLIRSLEPLLIIILGVLIGLMIIGLYLPIFQLGNVF